MFRVLKIYVLEESIGKKIFIYKEQSKLLSLNDHRSAIKVKISCLSFWSSASFWGGQVLCW